MMVGKRAFRVGFYSLQEIRFLRDIVQASVRSGDIQPRSLQAEVVARRVLDAYEDGVRSSDALVDAATRNLFAGIGPVRPAARSGTRRSRQWARR
jgi:hypothetical protein